MNYDGVRFKTGNGEIYRITKIKPDEPMYYITNDYEGDYNKNKSGARYTTKELIHFFDNGWEPTIPFNVCPIIKSLLSILK